jgi:hypothetical protein
MDLDGSYMKIIIDQVREDLKKTIFLDYVLAFYPSC